MVVSYECCVLPGRVLSDEANPGSEVLPTDVCRCMWSRNIKNEADLDRRWAVAAEEKKNRAPLQFNVKIQHLSTPHGPYLKVNIF
jgi:hypothetical protein